MPGSAPHRRSRVPPGLSPAPLTIHLIMNNAATVCLACRSAHTRRFHRSRGGIAPEASSVSFSCRHGGRRGTPGSRRTHGPQHLTALRLAEMVVTASPPFVRRPARGVSRLAPHEPRWTYQAPVLADAPALSTAGESPHRHLRGWVHVSARPGASCDARPVRRASCGLGRRIWVANPPAATASPLRQPNASGRRPSLSGDVLNIVLLGI
jgi:hypothetical protein